MRTRLSLRGAALGVALTVSASSAVLVVSSSAAGAAPVAVPKPAMRITEFSYQLRDFGEAEFVELTNVGTTPVNLKGWSFDDVDAVPGSFDLSSLGTAAPGESVIITDVTPEAFRSYWGLAPTVKVVGGSTQGLGNGDQINVWDDAANLVDRLTYDDTPRSRDNTVVPSALAEIGANHYDGWALSTAANDTGSQTVDAIAGAPTSIGSPGTSRYAAGPVTAPALPIRITEFSYQLRDFGDAEFVELTNVSAAPVNLDGWSFDDSSPVVGAFSLSGLGIVAPGESVVFTDTTPAAFRTYFGLCSAVKVVGGSTQGLGNGDEINVFDDAGNLADKVTYTSSPRSQDVSVVPTSAAALAANDYTQWALSSSANDPGSKTVDAVAGGSTSIASPGTSTYATVAFDPCPAPPEPTDPGIDLSTYGLVGRYALPSHLDVPSLAPSGSELATEVSAITYDWDTDTLFVVGDEGTSVVQVSKTGQLIDSMTLTGFEDTEGLTYVGNGKFVVGEERVRQAVLVTYTGGTTFARSSGQVVKLGTTVGNIGMEGIGYDPLGNAGSGLGFVGVKESGPLGIFKTTIDFAAGTSTNGSASTEPTNLFDPALVGTSDLSDVYPLSQVPSIDGGQNPNLLVISQETGRIVNINRSGAIANQLDIADVGAPLAVPAQTMEGVALDASKVMYTTAEGGGGDASHPQLLVWAPNASPLSRLAVTEVAPWGSDSSYGADWFELTNTGSTTLDLTGVKVDDSSNTAASAATLAGVASLAAGESAVFFEKPAAGDAATITAAFNQAWFGTGGPPAGFKIGSYTGTGLGLSGTSGDAVNVFAPDGTHVTGASFGAATANTTFDNTARLGAAAGPVAIKTLASEGVFGAFRAADGVALGSPGNIAPSGPVDPGGDYSGIKITEVAPFGSGSSPYAADWFEVTNNGTESVNLSGWKMDDSSALFTSGLELVGVPTLPAGKSAIFYEGSDDAAFQLAFAQSWFGQNLFDAGFLFGHYTGGGAGLSTGGDSVVLFAADGTPVTGVAFGAAAPAAPFATFDNAAGLGTATAPFPVLTTLSSVAVNGAFQGVDGNGIGSPGTATVGIPDAPTISASRSPLANGAGWNNEPVTVTFSCQSDALVSCTAPTTVSTDGADQSVTGTVTDALGRTASTTVSAINIDRVAPTLAGVAATAPNEAGWYHGPVTIDWSCTDALSGIAAGACPASSQTVGEGTAVSASASATDRAGNVTPATSQTVKVDQTAPSTGVSSPPTWAKEDVTLSLSSSDALSGVAVTLYKIDGGSVQTGTAPVVSGQGVHTVTYWSIDVAGNIEAEQSVTVRIDTDAPSITGQRTPAANSHGWNNTDVEVTFTCGDTGGSGVASCSSPQSFTGEVVTTATGTVADNAGNTASEQVPVRIDRSAPTVAAQVPPANGAGWFNQAVQVSFSCQDTGGSGIDSCPSPVVFGGEGADQPVTGTAYDNAGNAGSASGSTVSIDTTVPTITGAAVEPENPGGGHDGTVTVHWTCADALSGVVSCPADQQVSTEGVHVLTGSVADRAGNTATGQVTIVINHDPSTDPGTVHGTITDSGSLAPVAGAQVLLRLASSNAVVAATTTATDGTYSFPTVADGSYRVYAVLNKAYQGAYLPTTVVVTHGTNPASDLALAPTLALSGVVRTEGGTPISGATVRLAPSGLVAVTDASGAYRIPGNLPGPVTVRVLAYGMTPSSPQSIQLSGDRVLDQTLVPVAAGGGAKGTITAASNGAPIAGALVRVWAKDSAVVAMTVTTGADGRYSLGSLPVGTYEIDVVRGDYQVRWFGDALSRSGASPVTVTAGCTASPDPSWGDACAFPASIAMRR